MKEYCVDFFWHSLHKKGRTPFVYHTDMHGERHQHYKATFFVTAFVFYSVVHQFFAKAVMKLDLNRSSLQAFGAIGLIGSAAYLGFLAAIFHRRPCKKVINHYLPFVHFTGKKSGDEEEQTELLEKSQGTAINETSSLVIGKDKNDSLICRISKYNPLQLVFPPPTPFKTGAWITMIGLFAFAVANFIHPNLFNQYAGVTPVANNASFFVGCNTTTGHSEDCYMWLGFISGLVTFMVFISAGIGCVGTLFHYGAVKALERYQSKTTVESPSNEEDLFLETLEL